MAVLKIGGGTGLAIRSQAALGRAYAMTMTSPATPSSR
jgi:hypothetical protein